MRHEFKPGDLALVTKHENCGRCVSLVRLMVGPETFRNDQGYQEIPSGIRAWEVEADSLLGTVASSGKKVIMRNAAISERSLMPLRGDFHPDQQKAKEAEPCL